MGILPWPYFDWGIELKGITFPKLAAACIVVLMAIGSIGHGIWQSIYLRISHVLDRIKS